MYLWNMMPLAAPKSIKHFNGQSNNYIGIIQKGIISKVYA